MVRRIGEGAENALRFMQGRDWLMDVNIVSRTALFGIVSRALSLKDALFIVHYPRKRAHAHSPSDKLT